MSQRVTHVLVVGATGSIGRLVVEEALAQGYDVRALVRSAERARLLPAAVSAVQGDLGRPGSLAAALEGIDAVVFTHGSQGGKAAMEAVDYGGVRAVLAAVADRQVRVVLMTAIGITNRASSYNRSTESLDWKRRSERLVRASGQPFTVVRPGWFDCNAPDENLPVFLQGDLRRSGTPSDGGISRRLIARVLVAALSCRAAERKTLELVAERGAEPADLEPLFAALAADETGSLDGVRDEANMPLDREPQRVRDDLAATAGRQPSGHGIRSGWDDR